MFQLANLHIPIAPICVLPILKKSCALISKWNFSDRYLGRLKCTQLAVDALLEISCKLKNSHNLGSDNCIHLGNSRTIVQQEAEEDNASVPTNFEISVGFHSMFYSSACAAQAANWKRTEYFTALCGLDQIISATFANRWSCGLP